MKSKLTKGAMLLPLFVVGLPALAAGDGHGFDMTLFIAKIVNTLIFFGGLAYILKAPVSEFFRNRHKDIKDSLERAEVSVTEANSQINRIESQMANLDAELEQIKKQAREEAEASKQRLLAQAKQEVARIKEQAEVEIDNRRRQAVSELRTMVVDLAIGAAEKNISETITDKDRKKLFADFSARMGVES